MGKRPFPLLSDLGRRLEPKFEKEHQAYLDQLIKNRQEIVKLCGQSLARTYHWLLDGEYAARELSCFSDEERELFRETKRDFDEARQNLDAMLQRVGDPLIQAEILRVIDGLLWNGTTLARWAPPLEGNAKAIEMAAARRKALSANAAKLAKSSTRIMKLRVAIESVANGIDLVNSTAFAESIRDDVLKALGATDGWPSTRTIQRQISAILEERRKS